MAVFETIALKAGQAVVSAALARRRRGASATYVLAILLVLIFGPAIICGMVLTGLQSSTIVWPVAIPDQGAEASGWRAGGWNLSSTFGWRDHPKQPGTPEFHDGIDLTGETFCFRCPVPAIFDGIVDYVGWDTSGGSWEPDNQNIPKDQRGGGIIVKLGNGDQPVLDGGYVAGERPMTALFAHLEPYRLHLQLQGQIDDPWDQAAYRQYGDYQRIGAGELQPDVGEAAIVTSCTRQTSGGKVPEFVWTEVGPGTFSAVYDSPVMEPNRCTTAVEWPQRGGTWQGWTPDGPVQQPWQTPMEEGVGAGDVALRFRAHLVPPPPPPTPEPPLTPTPAGADPASTMSRQWASAGTPTPVGVQGSRTPLVMDESPACTETDLVVTCRWKVATIPTMQDRQLAEPAWHPDARSAAADRGMGAVAAPAPTSQATDAHAGTYATIAAGAPRATSARERPMQASATSQPGGVDCDWKGLVALPGVSAPDPRLQADVARSFEAIRQEVKSEIGIDALATLSEGLRPAKYGTSKPGVLYTSWHKAGRAVDLAVSFQGRIFNVVREGSVFRIHATGPRGTTDVTAKFLARGWNRIPPQGSVLEWWHYEYHPDGISWQSAMLQIYTEQQLESLLPQFDWNGGCTTGGVPVDGGGDPADGGTIEDRCQPGVPSWDREVEPLPGCGPPVTVGATIKMLDQYVGFVGDTGQVTGVHLHLGLQVQSASAGPWSAYPIVDVCRTEPYATWLREHGLDPDAYDPEQGWQSSCSSNMVDPLDFLPRAHAREPLAQATDAPADSEPYQLPPPGTDDALVFPDDRGRQWEWPWQATPGEYWSPNPEAGRFGGGAVLAWLCWLLGLIGGYPDWCS